MKRKFVFILSLFALLSTMLFVRFNTVEVKAPDGIDITKIYGVEMLWNNSMAVNDVAVSKDGNYIATVNNTGLYYFAANNSSPKWWENPPTYFISVAISADGEYVVVGTNDGYIYYFNNSRARTGSPNGPTWGSLNLYGSVERGTLDMSDDGDYVVVGGTGAGLYYFAGCKARSGSDESPTWQKIFGVIDFLTVHMSSDGKYVAAGGTTFSLGGFVVFYNDANAIPYPTEEAWFSSSTISGSIIDLAVSDDGYSVVAIDEGPIPSTLYYWANATNLSGDPDATWTRNWGFHCVDMSADGDEVIAGTALYPCGLHFWADARERSGYDQVENWTRREGEIIWDAAMSDNGGIIAASVEAESNYTAYFFKSDGNMIGEFDLLQYSPLVSMSGNGSITAIGGPGWDSLYVFRMIVDTTPPLIENVHQQPSNEAVNPEDDVMVYANVTDDLSGVKQVTLNYTYTNITGTWYGTVIMDNPEGNLYNGTIPRLPYCTNVTYVIIAEDNFNNTIISEEMEYRYHVIPEFPSQVVLPLLATTTLLAMLLRKRKLIHQAKT
jgi:WD40 repeat protein